MKELLIAGVFTIIGGLIGGISTYMSAIRTTREQRYNAVLDHYRSVISKEITKLEPSAVKGNTINHILDIMREMNAASVMLCFYVEDMESFKFKDMKSFKKDSDALEKSCTELRKHLAQDNSLIESDELVRILSDIRDKAIKLGIPSHQKHTKWIRRSNKAKPLNDAIIEK